MLTPDHPTNDYIMGVGQIIGFRQKSPYFYSCTTFSANALNLEKQLSRPKDFRRYLLSLLLAVASRSYCDMDESRRRQYTQKVSCESPLGC